MSGTTKKIFVGGLPRGCTKEVLAGYFMHFGTVVESVVKDCAKGRGFGFITYDSQNNLDMCADHWIAGKLVKVALALNCETGSFGPSEEELITRPGRHPLVVTAVLQRPPDARIEPAVEDTNPPTHRSLEQRQEEYRTRRMELFGAGEDLRETVVENARDLRHALGELALSEERFADLRDPDYQRAGMRAPRTLPPLDARVAPHRHQQRAVAASLLALEKTCKGLVTALEDLAEGNACLRFLVKALGARLHASEAQEAERRREEAARLSEEASCKDALDRVKTELWETTWQLRISQAALCREQSESSKLLDSCADVEGKLKGQEKRAEEALCQLRDAEERFNVLYATCSRLTDTNVALAARVADLELGATRAPSSRSSSTAAISHGSTIDTEDETLEWSIEELFDSDWAQAAPPPAWGPESNPSLGEPLPDVAEAELLGRRILLNGAAVPVPPEHEHPRRRLRQHAPGPRPRTPRTRGRGGSSWAVVNEDVAVARQRSR